MDNGPVLHLLCGKIAAGKSTLAARLSADAGTVLISEDDWLSGLFADRLNSGADYITYSAKLQQVMAPHVLGLLEAGVSVVLDFPANSFDQRRWLREMVAETSAKHQFHLLDVPDEVCLERLRARNAERKHAFAATETQFHQFAKHFAPPTAEEGFNLVVHQAVD